MPLQGRPRTPDARARVPRCASVDRLPDDNLGWPRTRSPACPACKRLPLMQRSAGASAARSAWSFDRFGWSGIRTRDRRRFRSLLYPTELSSGGHPGIEPGTSRCEPSVTGYPLLPCDAAWSAPTARGRVPPTGGVHEPLACERSPLTADAWAPGFVSPGAILSAGARPATRARRHGCACLRAERPRSGSARTAGTAAACLPLRACGRPCGRCMRRRR